MFARHPVLVVAFICTGCPTVKANEDRLIALQERYARAGVQLVAINANNPYLSPPDTYDEMVRRAREKRFTFPYLKDHDGTVAESFGAISTPNVFVLDASRRVVYKGRIDDARDHARATSSDLEKALRDLFAGVPVRVPRDPAIWLRHRALAHLRAAVFCRRALWQRTSSPRTTHSHASGGPGSSSSLPGASRSLPA